MNLEQRILSRRHDSFVKSLTDPTAFANLFVREDIIDGNEILNFGGSKKLRQQRVELAKAVERHVAAYPKDFRKLIGILRKQAPTAKVAEEMARDLNEGKVGTDGAVRRRRCCIVPDCGLTKFLSFVKKVSPFLLIGLIAVAIFYMLKGDSEYIKDMEVIVINDTEYRWLKRPNSDAPIVISARDGSAVFRLLNTLSKNTETVNNSFQIAYEGLRHYPNLQLDLLNLAESVASLNFRSFIAFEAFVPAGSRLLENLEGFCWFLYLGEKSSAEEWFTSASRGTQSIISDITLIEQNFDEIWLKLKAIKETVSWQMLSLNQNLTEIREEMKMKKVVVESVASEKVVAAVNLLFNDNSDSTQNLAEGLMSFFGRLFTGRESVENSKEFLDDDDVVEDNTDYQELLKEIQQNPNLVQSINRLNTLAREEKEVTYAIAELNLAAVGIRPISIAVNDTNSLMDQLRGDIKVCQEEMDRQFKAMQHSSSAILTSLHGDPFKIKIVGFYSQWVAMGTIFHEASVLFKTTKESLDEWIKGTFPKREVHTNAFDLIDHVKS